MDKITKFCHRCSQDLPRTSFSGNKRRKDGLQSYCKLCMKKENQKNYKKHKEAWDKRTKKHGKTESSKKYRREWAKKKYHDNEEHRKNCIKKVIEYERKKLDSDPEFKLKHTLRNRLRKAIKKKNAKKCKKTMDLIGCSTSKLMNHLESKFQEGMSWKNHGEWHIDHIKAIAKFNLLDENEQKKCFHWSNLQPLWAEENISKGDK
jgi:hypothetical protein